MIRTLIVVALVFLIAAGFAWLAERPGELLLTWQGHEIRTSLMVASIGLAIVIAMIAAVGALLRAILSSPQSLGHFLGARRRDRGYRALTRGMIAVGAGDVRAARRAAQESRSLLGQEPLALLLSAQAAQIAGDAPAARTAFESLSAEADTRLLGLHGLFVEARRQGEHGAARHFAEEAGRIAPRLGWAGAALFEYQSRAGDWQDALATLATNAGNGLVDKARARRLRAVLLTAQALEMEAGNPDEARAAATEAHKLAPDLVPAAIVASRLYTRQGDIRRATRILEATWKIGPQREVAEAYADARPGDSALDRLKRARRLADLRPNHPEGAMAVARAAIDARDWPTARSALGGMMRANPSERVCLLMAEIEEGETGEQGRVRAWLTRALSAPRDAQWMADGQAFERWAPVSPISGRLDAFEWRVPAERPLALAADAALAVYTSGVGASDDTNVEPHEPATASGQAASGNLPVPTLLRAVEPRPARSPLAGAPSGAAAGPRPMARAPDDPGPAEPGEEEVSGLSVFRPTRTA
jgi:HemY protein